VKVFVDWVLSQRYWLVLTAIVLTPFLPMLTAGLMVLNTAQRGTPESAAMAAAGVGVLGVLAVATAGGWLEVTAIGAFAIACGLGMGALLNMGGTLTLAFQGTVLASYLLAGAVTLFGPGQEALVGAIVDRIAQLWENGETAGAALDLAPGSEAMLLGIAYAAVFAQLIGALFIGYWWFGLARNEPRFGPEFRSLKLGRVLGFPAMVLVTAGLLVQAPIVQNLTPIALFGFLFQGAAVMHAWAYAKQWHPVVVLPVYALLITPWMWVPILGLSAVGLLDTIFEVRGRLRVRE
jgi:hypothetical protein